MPDTQRVLLIGSAVSQSMSLAFQNAGFRAAGIDCRYEAIDVMPNGLAGVVAEIRRDERILGANVTIPHKETVIPLLDQVDPEARAIGAVNTIKRVGSNLVGFNTDGKGFLKALDELGFDPTGKTAVVVGAGGAARALVAVLKPKASRLWIVNRTAERASQLCEDLGIARDCAVRASELDRILPAAALVVNATPVDLALSGPVAPSWLYVDIRSKKSAAGRLMLLHQGLAAFEIWTGRPAPAGPMRSALMGAAQGATA